MKKVKIGENEFAEFFRYERTLIDEILHPDWFKVIMFIIAFLWTVLVTAIFLKLYYVLFII